MSDRPDRRSSGARARRAPTVGPTLIILTVLTLQILTFVPRWQLYPFRPYGMYSAPISPPLTAYTGTIDIVSASGVREALFRDGRLLPAAVASPPLTARELVLSHLSRLTHGERDGAQALADRMNRRRADPVTAVHACVARVTLADGVLRRLRPRCRSYDVDVRFAPGAQ